MYNVHPYFSLKNLGKKVHIIHSRIQVSHVPHCRGEQVQGARVAQNLIILGAQCLRAVLWPPCSFQLFD